MHKQDRGRRCVSVAKLKLNSWIYRCTENVHTQKNPQRTLTSNHRYCRKNSAFLVILNLEYKGCLLSKKMSRRQEQRRKAFTDKGRDNKDKHYLLKVIQFLGVLEVTMPSLPQRVAFLLNNSSER